MQIIKRTNMKTNDGLITLAIHSQSKAEALRKVLLEKGIAVYLEPATEQDNQETNRFFVKVPLSQLEKAIAVMGTIFSPDYIDQVVIKDDGKVRILIAVDFSEDSIKACQLAFNLAKKFNAKVKILHVYNNVYLPSHFPFANLIKEGDDDGMLNVIRKRMLDFCLEIDKKITANEWPSVNYSYSIREGFVVEEIAAFIKEYKPILLVMGTQGEHRTENNLIGSVTADVLEMTDVAVMAVPKSSPIQSLDDIKHIVYLISLKEWGPNSFDRLATFVSYCRNIKITLLHINQKDRELDIAQTELNKILYFLKEKYPEWDLNIKVVEADNIVLTMEEIEKSKNVSIFCVNTKKRNLFGRIFAPSFSRKLLQNFNQTLLVLRDQK